MWLKPGLATPHTARDAAGVDPTAGQSEQDQREEASAVPTRDLMDDLTLMVDSTSDCNIIWVVIHVLVGL